jgi:hypothetical protein
MGKSKTHLNEEGLRNNHCIARLEFKNIVDKETRDVPGKTIGVILDLEYDLISEATTQPGKFHVKTINYDKPHQLAVKSIRIPIHAYFRRLKEFLKVIDDTNLLPCGFNVERPSRAVGCKDFM